MDANTLCDAMKEAGIDDAQTRRGIRFCVDKCPYSHCVVAEPSLNIGSRIPRIYKPRPTNLRREQAVMLRAAGVKVSEIAKRLEVSRITIYKYLEHKEAKDEK